jgi:hypothetical protein
VPSTAHRLLATLVKRDYVTQNAITGRYLLGFKVVEVASGLEQRLSGLRAAASVSHDCDDVTMFLDGGSDTAGFVQVIRGAISDEQETMGMFDRWLAEIRPGAIGWLGASTGSQRS